MPFDPTGRALKKDSDMYKALDVLARKVGVIGVFSELAGERDLLPRIAWD